MTMLEQFPDGEVLAIQDNDERVDAITKKILSIACFSSKLNDQFNLLLSGNQSLETVYAMLMLDPDLRGLPWHTTHVWKLHPDVEDHSIYEMITAHSGMPEEHTHQEEVLKVLEKDDPPKFDCCIIDLADVAELPENIASECKTIIVVAHDREALAKASPIQSGGDVFWFTSTIDLHEESQ